MPDRAATAATSLLSAPSYGKAFARAFAQRTVYVLLLSNGCFMALLYLLDFLGLMRNVLHGRFYAWAGIGMVSLTMLVLVRIRLMTRPCESLLNRYGVELLAASCAHALAFTMGQAWLYRPAATAVLAYPEGKYGPGMLLEPFVCLLVFAAACGLGGAALLGTSFTNDQQQRDKLNVEDEVKSSLNKLSLLLPVGISGILVGYVLVMGLNGQLLLRGTRLFLRQFFPLRPTFHSLWTCLDLGLFFHLAWTCASFLCTCELINLVTRLIMAPSFRLARSSMRPAAFLLTGLQAQHPTIRTQALFELHNILLKDPATRAKIFGEFVGDEQAAGRALAEWLISQIKDFNDELRSDLAILRAVEEALAKEEEGEPRRVAERQGEGKRIIFAPTADSLLGSLLRRFTPAVAEADSSRSREAEPRLQQAIPSVLALPRPSIAQKEAEREKDKGEQKLSKATWLSRHAQSMASFTPLGPLVLGLSVQYRRTRLVTSSSHTRIALCSLQALSRLATIAFTEDTLGQVQFCLDAAMSCLLDTFFLLLDLHASLSGDVAQQQFQEVSLTDAGERAFHRVLLEASLALEQVHGVYTEAFEKQSVVLSAETKRRLDNYTRLLASI